MWNKNLQQLKSLEFKLIKIVVNQTIIIRIMFNLLNGNVYTYSNDEKNLDLIRFAI